MDSLKDKLEKNIMIYDTHDSQCYLKKEELIKTDGFYEWFANWVSDEFGLLLQHESDD